MKLNKNEYTVEAATGGGFFAYLAEVLPGFDRDRVHASDVKKLISWYNLLVNSGMTDFEEETVAEENAEEEK